MTVGSVLGRATQINEGDSLVFNGGSSSILMLSLFLVRGEGCTLIDVGVVAGSSSLVFGMQLNGGTMMLPRMMRG